MLYFYSMQGFVAWMALDYASAMSYLFLIITLQGKLYYSNFIGGNWGLKVDITCLQLHNYKKV